MRNLSLTTLLIFTGFVVVAGGLHLLALPLTRIHPQVATQILSPSTKNVPLRLPKPAATGTAPLNTPMVGTPSSTPPYITLRTPSTVTLTAQISPQPIPGGVNLLRLGATGTQPTVLGTMHDDGQNGDSVAGDGIFSIQAPFNEPSAGEIQLQISAAFQGSLKRVLSSSLNLTVLNVYTDNLVGITLQYPANLSIVIPPSGANTLNLQSTPRLLALGESFGDTSSTTDLATDGYSVTVCSAQYPQPFDINTWLANVMPAYDVATVSPIIVSGNSAFAVTFDDIHVPKPLVIVPHGSTIYTVAYTSTYDPGTSNEADGLAEFYKILNHIQFLK